MKSEVRYGLYYGGVSILWVLVMYVTEWNRSKYAGYLNNVAFIGLTYLIFEWIKEFKNTNDGFATVSEIFKGGLIIGVVGGVTSSVFLLIQVKLIDTEYIGFVIKKTINDLQESGYSGNEIDQMKRTLEKFSTPNMIMFWNVFFNLSFSALISLIFAQFMKKPNPNEIA